MDFFEAQARAKRRTTPLVALFCLAVVGTIAGLYFAFVAGTAFVGLRANAHGGGFEGYSDVVRGGISVIDWWQPGALKAITYLVIPTIGFSTLFKWLQLRSGGSAVATDVGGRRVAPDTTDPRERMLMNVVEEMSIASGMAVPAVFILPGEASINAFAAGYTRSDAAVAVTRGALERLNRDELQGVVAHEFSHILNGDMRINTRLIALLYGILSLVILGRGLVRAAFYAGDSSDKKGIGGALPLAIGGFALIIVGGIGLLAGRLIQAAVSRQREYLADAAAVQFTRNPGGIAGALKKLGAHALGGRLSHPAANEVSHFCFAQNFRSHFGGLFATHPPLDERIRLLDPSFDGVYPELPPLAPAPKAVPPPPPRRAAPPPRVSPVAMIASTGILTADTIHAAHGFIASLPGELHDAAHNPASVSALACAVCLAPDLPAPAREQALAIVTRHLGATIADQTRRLHGHLSGLLPSAGLSVLQLAAPALRQLEESAQDELLETLDELVHADGTVCPREFALQKIIARDLRLAARPHEASGTVAPNESSPHLSVALSFAVRLDARIDASDEGAAELFANVAASFSGLHPPLAYVPSEQSTLGHLDRALDQLALTPAPFRKRILGAVAAALTADNELSPSDADLIRAIAAALDCPIPPHI